jgi:hypothetical protein
MGLFGRVGAVIKNYLQDEDTRIFKQSSQLPPYDDPDIQNAFEEVNAFLTGRPKAKVPAGGFSRTEYRHTEYTKGGARYSRTEYSRTEWLGPKGGRGRGAAGREAVPIPEDLRGDFAELGLPFGAKPDACKNAYKRLLKIHHPDRHSSRPDKMQAATEKTARLNAAYDRIERWRATGTA